MIRCVSKAMRDRKTSCWLLGIRLEDPGRWEAIYQGERDLGYVSIALDILGLRFL